jgi:hypothetical protein
MVLIMKSSQHEQGRPDIMGIKGKVLLDTAFGMRDSMWPIKINRNHMKSSMTKTSHTGMIIEMRDSIWPLRKNYKHMKSSMTKTSHTGMIIEMRDSIWPLRKNYKHMKSSMTRGTYRGMNIQIARFHMAAGKKNIII